MLTDYQVGQLTAFQDGIRAGRTSFPEDALAEIGDILDILLVDEMRTRKIKEAVAATLSKDARSTLVDLARITARK